jgi:hypothetical protein
LDGLRGVQQYLHSTNISMSLSGGEKLLNRMGFKAKRKNKTNFVSAANKKFRLAWALKHKQLTVSDWRKWVFSGKTRVNIGGSDSEFFYWSDVPAGTNRPHQVRPQVQGIGDGITVCFGAAYQATDLAIVLQLLMGRLIQISMWKF